MWILTLRSPKSIPQDYILQLGKNTLGRKLGNDIVIQDELASRLHAEIDCSSDRLVIQDLGSTNGTFVNQKRLTGAKQLNPGDQIRVGYHLANIAKQGEEPEIIDILTQLATQPLTQETLLEAYEQNAVLIYEVANRLTTVLDLEASFQELADFLKTAIGAEHCAVLRSNQFEEAYTLGYSETLIHMAIEQRGVVLYPDTQLLASFPSSPELDRVRSALCIPIFNQNDTIAMVLAYKADPQSRPFDQKDVQLSIAISHQAALAIQRSQIIEQAQILEQWALTDSLTGLDNRRHILKKAEIEYRRAIRYHHPLTTIIMDIDNFKLVNDTYGHFVGDNLMRIVAERCKQQMRNVDLFGRYGGDEFLIMLVETSFEDAISVAKRLCQCVSEKPMISEQAQVYITVSLGIAPFCEDCSDAIDLIRRADDALLYAKGVSKNNIGVYEDPGRIIDFPGEQ